MIAMILCAQQDVCIIEMILCAQQDVCIIEMILCTAGCMYH